MTDSVTLRRATAADAVPLAQILSAWTRETGWMPTLHSVSENAEYLYWLIRERQVWVARVGPIPQGFAARHDDEVTHLFVARQVRGRGLGHMLLEQAREGRDHLKLWTFQANAAARRFYAREGFEEVARSDGWRNEEGLPDVLCVWHREAEDD